MTPLSICGHLASMPRETPGQALRRTRLEHHVPVLKLVALLQSSSSAIQYAETGRRRLPLRWLPRLPPPIAVPVIAAVIDEKLAELDRLGRLLQKAQHDQVAGKSRAA